MSVARFIADQRTRYRVPHAVCCRFLGLSQAWFYKWAARPARAAQAAQESAAATSTAATSAGRSVAGPAGLRGRARQRWLDAQVRASFEASGGTYGSPRVHDDLLEAGWRVSVNTVAASMRRQRLAGRPVRRRRGLTRPDKAAVPFPDLLRRDFTATAPNQRWVGDVTEIPTDEGKLYQATVIDLFGRRLLASATGPSPNAQLCKDAIKIAVAARGGKDAVPGVIFHSDRGSTYTDHSFSALCRDLGIVQSMGRVGSCFDNAAAESFFSTLEFEVLSRHTFATRDRPEPLLANGATGSTTTTGDTAQPADSRPPPTSRPTIRPATPPHHQTATSTPRPLEEVSTKSGEAHRPPRE